MVTWIRRKDFIPLEKFIEVDKRLHVSLPQDYIHRARQYISPESGHVHILIDNEPYDFDGLYDPEEEILEQY
jgi:hypothetical protein